MGEFREHIVELYGKGVVGIVIVALVAIGGLVLINWASIFLEEIWNRLLRPGKNLPKLGKWAVVTGATDGIGFAFAEELARKGMSILLISRTQSKLDDCCEQIRGKYKNVTVDNIACDYSRFATDVALRDTIQAKLDTIEVGVLINNVGASYEYTTYFHEISDEKVNDLMDLNVNSTTWMTRMVLPQMIGREKGAIVNISSAAGMLCNPLLAQYSAAKAYVKNFSLSLNEELRDFNISVQCQVPLFVVSKLAKVKKGFDKPMPNTYAKAAVAAIGYEPLCSPYWVHALELWVMMSLPEFISNWVVKSMHLGIRRGGIKKKEREAAAAADGGSAPTEATRKSKRI